MEKSAVQWFYSQLTLDKAWLNQGRKDELFEQAKEMENQHNISFLEWIRENAVEVQDGWQYLGKAYTDKQIIEMYNKTFKSK